MKLSKDIQAALRCPICKSALGFVDTHLQCEGGQCASRFPVVDGVPILINEARSLFSPADFLKHQGTTFRQQPKLERLIAGLIPELSFNFKAKQNYRRFAELLLQQSRSPKVLVVGSGEMGRGMETLTSVPSIEFINSDVFLGSDTSIICDSHDVPFTDCSFDAVIIQAVLEHVADPSRCVEEIHRVLKKEGLVYAETPFLQQVHGGPYDFTRFTDLGHRRLFRNFTEICSGATAGSGTALAWSYQYFLLSFVKSNLARAIVKGVARLTAFWLRYFDYYLIDKPGTLDAASGYYFMGKKSNQALSDRELVKLYRGAGSVLPTGVVFS